MNNEIRKAIADTGAILEGEYFFALKKQGNISTKYINLDPVFTHPRLVDEIAEEMIEPDDQNMCDVIAVPAVGAIPLGYAAARAILSPKVRVVWADKQKDESFAFERMGFMQAVKGKSVLVLEDISSTGGSAKAVCDLVRAADGTVYRAGFVWNRGNVKAEDLGVPSISSIITESVETFKDGKHGMWEKWPLVMDIGHPEYFPDYPGPRIKLLK